MGSGIKGFKMVPLFYFHLHKDEQQNCAVNLHLKCHLKVNHSRNVIHNPWAQQIKTAEIQTLVHRYNRVECKLTLFVKHLETQKGFAIYSRANIFGVCHENLQKKYTM